MEGKYTKISALVAIIALAITLWQIFPRSEKRYSGEWNMSVEIEYAHLNQYNGMKIEWILHLIQSGNQLAGTAEKVAVNSIPLPFTGRTSLKLQGSVEDNKFILNFTEKGKLRETSGIFSGEFENDKFFGLFSSTASDSRGKISGYKVN